jgi:hypothetical protein
MNTLSKNCAFDAKDREVYSAWLRGTLAAYGAVVLCGVAAVLLATSNPPDVAEYLTTAVALAAP